MVTHTCVLWNRFHCSLLSLTSSSHWLQCRRWCWGKLESSAALMHEGVPSGSSITFEKERDRADQGYRCGRWASDCTDSCEGREAFQNRKWLDLPCGRQTQPDISPHGLEHPGSLWAPAEGRGVTAAQQEGEKTKTCCAVSPLAQLKGTLFWDMYRCFSYTGREVLHVSDFN